EACTKISPAGSSLKILEIAAALALKSGVVTHSVLLPAHSFWNRSRGFATGAKAGSFVCRACRDAGEARAALTRARILARLGFSIRSNAFSPESAKGFGRNTRRSAIFGPRTQRIEHRSFQSECVRGAQCGAAN